MICPKCKNDGIFNTVAGKDFYYCRSCKEEIILETPPHARKSATKKYPIGADEYECNVEDCTCHVDVVKHKLSDLFRGIS